MSDTVLLYWVSIAAASQALLASAAIINQEAAHKQPGK